ncbi:MAG: TauD/TfdA family dioxygenase, partial [Acidimicrobiia bacterium]|nr:TauD/TfdA family dioxygenase [Acidimicrobiia bacterium]
MTKLDHEREASAWSGTELVRPPLEITLDGRQRAELLATLDSLRSSGLGIVDVEPGHVRLPSLAADIARIDTEVRDGSGFALVHGFPVEGLTVPEIELAYWALCTQLGTGVTQNSDAGFIHYVTDGELRPQQGKRGVGNPGPTPLHVDLSDCVSLLCVRQARDDPPSWLASSTYVYHEVARRRPDLAELLHRGFEWDRLEEHR